MGNFFHEVREFFSVLFKKPKPQYIGFLRTLTLKNDKPSKGAKNRLGFIK